MSRDREKTKKKILKAATSIIERDGLAALTVNGLARKADIGKPLIYRYFGNLKGVSEALLVETRADIGAILRFEDYPASLSPRDFRDNLIGFGRAVASDCMLRQGLLSMFSDTKLELRNLPRLDRGIDGLDEWKREVGGKDIAALYAILKAAVAFLVLYRERNKTWCDLGIETANDMARLEYALISIMDSLSMKTSQDPDSMELGEGV